MGLRAQNNPNASFEDPFVNTGKNAWKPYVAPFGIQASGGVINDWYLSPTSPSGVGTYYRTHMFQVPGSFVVSDISNDTDLGNDVDILIVGGGGGGAGDNAGGGGAGGALFYSEEPETFGQPAGEAYTVTAQTYPITVGEGGPGSRSISAVPGYPLGMPNSNPDCQAGVGINGTNSVFSTPTGAVYTAGYGGGGGGYGPPTTSNYTEGQDGGPAGGSGGGAGKGSSTAGAAGGSGPPTGWAGGACPTGPGNADTGGGGGSEGQPAGSGKNGDGPTGPYFEGGDGGDGMVCKVLGPMLPDAKSYWAGGGGGAKSPPAPNYDGRGGAGGAGGGGGGCGSPTTPDTSPTGSGGGYGFVDGGTYTHITATPPYGDGASDTGDMSQWCGAGRFTGGGGGATGGGPPNPWNPSTTDRKGNKGMRGGNGAPGTCIIRYKISDTQYHPVKATGGYTSQYNDKTIHVFVEPGTFTNTSDAPLDCEVVTIAGGGGGGCDMGGGGGAGGFLVTPTTTVGPAAPNAITVTVGAGGIGQFAGPSTRDHGAITPGSVWPSPDGMAQNGENSSFGPTIVATGGGAGGQKGSGTDWSSSSGNGNPGGSGGGTGAGPAVYTGGTETPTQGYAGGSGLAPPVQAGGGGGGAGGVGGDASPTLENVGGSGGIGKQLPTTFQDPQMGWGEPGPSPGRWFCGGGGGGSYGWNTGPGPTGSGWWNPSGGGGPRGTGGATPWAGGGNGGCFNCDSPLAGCDGVTNTGGGGGGGGTTPTNIGGGHGGPGIVFVAYDNPSPGS